MAVLPIDDIVRIIINLSPRSAVRKGFNLSLIIGDSEVISLDERVRLYTGADGLLDDGFSKDSIEYQAALIYFMQSSKPGRLAVGRWDSENEKLADAVTACRTVNRDWYMCLPLSPTSEDVLEIARVVEAARPSTVFTYTTKDVELLASMKGMNYRRSIGWYSQTALLSVAVAGWAMGANTGLRDSSFTLAFKTLVGVPVDDLNANLIEALKKVNGNYYVNRGAEYDGLEWGNMADGVWFDEILNLDMLENDMQLCIMDLLHSRKKVPQTEGGVLMIIGAFKPALDKAVRTGFIAPGIWKGPPIMDLETGDAIPEGYRIQSESIDDQAQADRDARMAPPIYTAIKLAGAIHYVVVQVDVNR